MGVPVMMTILMTEVIDIVLLRTKIPIVSVTVMAVVLTQLTMDQQQMKWMTTQVYGDPKGYLKHLDS